MKNKTINALLELGMPANLLGFRYIVDSMCLLEYAQWRNGRTLALYGEVGRMNNTTSSRVERAIRHAFKFVLKKGKRENLEKYLTLQNTTNGNLLRTLYLRLAQEG